MTHVSSLRAFCGFTLVCWLAGCQPSADSTPVTGHSGALNRLPQATASNAAAEGDAVVAKVGDEVITEAQVDAKAQLRLYDLALAAHNVRQAALDELIAQAESRQGARARNVALPAPEPPRMTLNLPDVPVRGTANASVMLDVFYSYPSSHCARLHPHLLALLRDYDGLLGIRFHDFPQSFHRDAPLAAQAMWCAHAQDAGWRYQDRLLAQVEQQSRDDLVALAQLTQLDSNRFQTCLDNAAHAQQVNLGYRSAIALDLPSVPITFINGIYLRGPQSYASLSEWVNRELQRLRTQIADAPTDAEPMQRTQLPLVLLATTVSSQTDQSKALLEADGSEAHFFALNTEVMDRVTLTAIFHDRVVLNHAGTLEFLPIHAGTPSDDANPGLISRNGLYDFAEAPAAGTVTPLQSDDEDITKTPSPTAVMELSRDWLDEQLLRQSELQAEFHAAEHQVEGRALLKLDSEQVSDFYQTLGMQEGDVLLRVNDQWVHDGTNPLWDALHREDTVTAVIFRKGKPVVYEYPIVE